MYYIVGFSYYIRLTKINILYKIIFILLNYEFRKCKSYSCFCRGCFTDEEGDVVLLSKILSPMSLAASTMVDSTFSPSFLTSLFMNFDLKKLKIHFFHRKIGSVVQDKPTFNGFIIDENVVNEIYSKNLELIQLVVSNLSLKSKFMIEGTHLMVRRKGIIVVKRIVVGKWDELTAYYVQSIFSCITMLLNFLLKQFRLF